MTVEERASESERFFSMVLPKATQRKMRRYPPEGTLCLASDLEPAEEA